jgi:uncharacterized protein
MCARAGSPSSGNGIDFVEAQALWMDEGLRELRVEYEGETRFMMIGRIGSRHWTAVITYRGDNVRLISVRSSRTEEIEPYGC